MANDQRTTDARKDKRDRRAYKAKQRADRLAAGLCIHCARSPHDPGFQMCGPCRDRRKAVIAASHRRCRVRAGKPECGTPVGPPASADMAAYRRRWRERCRAEGICTNCGCRPALEGRTRCGTCLARDRPKGRAKYARNAAEVCAREKAEREGWRAAGLCTFCGGARDDLSRARCRACNDYARQKLTELAATRKAADLCPKCGTPGDGFRCAACLERERASYRRQMAVDPDKMRARFARRRRLIRLAGEFTGEEWAAVKAAQGHACLLCGRREPEIALTVDHVIPVNRGGDNCIANIGALCERCNKSKGDKLIDDYRVLAPFPELFPWFRE